MNIRGNNDPNVGKYRSGDGVIYPHIVVPTTQPIKQTSNVTNTKESQPNILDYLLSRYLYYYSYFIFYFNLINVIILVIYFQLIYYPIFMIHYTNYTK